MSKEAMKLALEYLEESDNYLGSLDHSKPIAALREALAEQPAQQEPVLQDIEQYRLQMSGISTAAIGYWKEGDGIHPDYDTLALRDVAKLYAKYDELYRARPEQRKPLPKGEWPKHPSPYVNDEYRGYLKSDLDDYAMQVLAAHGIKENT